jgi:acyl transferase domain-containing protein/SAM-dependent methyltransferase/acyl carrier protein
VSTELSPVKQALLEIRELRARLAELEGAAREPMAIVGLAIRAPGGVTDAASFARLLWSGTDAISEIPAQRWSLQEWYDEAQDAPGKMTTRYGGFLGEVDRFDAEFFGISPVEAASMDPQQRLLLELAWEALENAGHAPTSLAGTRAGIYIGIANGDYGRSLLSHPELIDAYFSPGNSFSVASGRLAYFLGTHGPAVSVDTACSASLVALHLACQGLRAGECDLALVGGVNLILTPELNVNFSKAGMMARDGRCKTFDAAADGYVRGEGGVVLVLRPLRAAQADGDRVLAVIRGSAINQDGRSNGLTAPNGPAQEAVLRAALRSADVSPASIGYVEAHGTGTSLGDPIEVNALGAVLSEGRNAHQPLMLGSVKTNIGHLEAAAGLAGVAKTVLALQQREIPPHLHLGTLNPYIDWPSLPVTVPTRTTAWNPIDGRRLAGVSSFGFSGTNAHVILEEAPPVAAPRFAGPLRTEHVLTLSARAPQALRELADRYIAELRGPHASDFDLADFCFTANVGRAHFPHRLAARGATAAALVEALSAFREGQTHPALVTGTVGGKPPRIAFLFPGQGPQYVGMGRALYDTCPTFRAAFDECADILDGLLPKPLRSVVFASTGEVSPLDETLYAQPAMFAIEVALAALWRSWGIEPVAVMGHSFGEYAAACVAGAMQLSDAARMVAARGRLVQGLPRNGAMTVVEASEADLQSVCEQYAGRVAIGAINGPTNTVISGEREAVEEIAAGFAASGLRVKRLRVSHAFHSPLVEPVLADFEREISAARYHDPRILLISNLSGQVADRALFGNSGYWRDHMRRPVRFMDSIRTLADQGVTHYVEMSPHPVLLGMGSEIVAGQWLPSLREGQADWPLILHSLQELYCSGAAVDWKGFDRDAPRRRVALPPYPFVRKRHWIDTGAPRAAADPVRRWQRLLGTLDRQAQRGPLDLNPSSYPAKWECLTRLTVAHAVQTFIQVGVFTSAGERHTTDGVLTKAAIAPTYRHLIRRWLEALVGTGLLRNDRDTFIADEPLADPGLDRLWQEATRLFEDNQPLLAYVRNCGSLLGAVLTGRESPLETLFPGGSFELARALYERSTMMRYINSLAAAAFEELAASVPAGRVLRVLEIGAGTGGTTSALLEALPPERTRYHFTDVSDAFLDEARRRFAGRAGLEFGLFDLGRELEPQGYAAGSFDVVVSANCVHATKDLREALRRLRSLLSPGGVLVLIESTVHLDYFDMTTGLIEGWQHFADDLRTDNPLLPAATWVEALEGAGFTEARAWPPAGCAAEWLGQHVILACAPGDARLTAASRAGEREYDPEALTDEAAGSADEEWLQSLARALPAEQLDLMIEKVRSHVMQVLRLDAASPPARHDRLMDLGMDSLMAIQLRNALNKALRLQRSLPSTMMFDYPTIEAMAQYLLTRVSAAPAVVASEQHAATHAAVESTVTLGEAAVAAMSDAQIEELLLERLGKS